MLCEEGGNAPLSSLEHREACPQRLNSLDEALRRAPFAS